MFLEICIVQQKKQVGAQSPWLIQPLPCRWNYHTWTVRSNSNWSNTSLLQHENGPFVIQAPVPLNHLKESDIQSYVFNLLFQCRKARFESKFISRMRFYHLNFVLLVFIDWISNFHLPFCLQSHRIFCNNSFLIHLAKVDWQKHVPFSCAWNWLSSRKLPGIVCIFQPS